ncbi:hypothetical protein [Pseudotabrizicola sediminis]|uniref:hypothetical protein n=1 Tax=Pseudotabrizicola sediminis TaxID=2486418 RepID=UPI001FD8EBE2|nr:hypothetical protein [Pseudotabrizicola sediminis]
MVAPEHRLSRSDARETPKHLGNAQFLRRDTVDHRHVVRDEEKARALLSGQTLQHGQHLLLHRYIKR